MAAGEERAYNRMFEGDLAVSHGEDAAPCDHTVDDVLAAGLVSPRTECCLATSFPAVGLIAFAEGELVDAVATGFRRHIERDVREH